MGSWFGWMGRHIRWTLAMAALALVLALAALAGWAASVEDAASSTLGPVQRAFRQVGEPISNLLAEVDDFGRLESENHALRSRIEQLEAENARLREQQIQVRGRQELLQVQAEADAVLLTANVITRDLTGLRTIVGLDRGSDDGVRVGLPVIAAGGTLVGIVIDVRSRSSFVRLITDPDSAVRVLHQQSRIETVASGDAQGNLDVEIPWTAEVELGHVFVTSGLDGLLPQGLPVGRASAAEGTVQDAFRHVRLQPLAPLDQLEQVLIQLTIPPPDLTYGEEETALDATPEDGVAAP